MQAMLYGYAGLRLFDDRLALSPKLPPHTTNVTLTHVRRRPRR
jgi:trehalose/maltose hydrolase-like predicted phosphorylase